MKKCLVSMMLLTMLITGCDKEATDTVDKDAFNLSTQTTAGNTEETDNTEEETKATATSLISKFITDVKSGMTADMEMSETVGLDVNSVKGKTYQTQLFITEKGTFNTLSDKARIDGYLKHYYRYNTNYADVFYFLYSDKVNDSKDLIDKKAKEYTQNLSLYTGKKTLCSVDDKVFRSDSKTFKLTDLVISDFSNLTFKEDKGYTVTATISDKMFGNLFNFEDIYMGTKVSTSGCTYNIVFTFDKSMTVTGMTFELAKGVGTYSEKADRLNDMYIKDFHITFKNVTFGEPDVSNSLKANVAEKKDFLRLVNKY